MKTYFVFAISLLLLLTSCGNKEGNEIAQKTKKTSRINLSEPLTEEILENKTYYELAILRNEIFARKGFVFKDSLFKSYFAQKDWYKPVNGVKISLNRIEKKNVALMKDLEAKLMPVQLPAGYKKIVVLDKSNNQKTNRISTDFDNDKTKDLVQFAKNKVSGEQVLILYLSSDKKFREIPLDPNSDYTVIPNSLSMKNNTITYSFNYDKSGGMTKEFKLKYSTKIRNIQLIKYASSNSMTAGHLTMDYDLITGTYEVNKKIVDINNPAETVLSQNKGIQKTRIITPNLISNKFYDYLEGIGDEYKEDPYESLEDKEDCKKLLVDRLALEFEYGNLNYLRQYRIFKKELKDFISSIDEDELLNSNKNVYSKSYYLHGNGDLDYIKEHKCEDELYMVFDTVSNTFRIQINNCMSYAEDDVSETEQESIIFEYKIQNNCTYKFARIDYAG